MEWIERKLNDFAPVFGHKSSSLFGTDLNVNICISEGFATTGLVGLFGFFSDENPDASRRDASIF